MPDKTETGIEVIYNIFFNIYKFLQITERDMVQYIL